MARIRWTLTTEDAERYSIAEPQIFDTETLRGLSASRLEELEDELLRHAGLYIVDLYPARDRNLRIPRAIMWITLRMAGSPLGWEEFDPQVLRARFEDADAGDDVDPPADGPAENSSPTG